MMEALWVSRSRSRVWPWPWTSSASTEARGAPLGVAGPRPGHPGVPGLPGACPLALPPDSRRTPALRRTRCVLLPADHQGRIRPPAALLRWRALAACGPVHAASDGADHHRPALGWHRRRAPCPPRHRDWPGPPCGPGAAGGGVPGPATGLRRRTQIIGRDPGRGRQHDLRTAGRTLVHRHRRSGRPAQGGKPAQDPLGPGADEGGVRGTAPGRP